MRALAWLMLVACSHAKTIYLTDYGAKNGTGVSPTTAQKNGQALYKAMTSAKAGDVVEVPAGQRIEIIPNETLLTNIQNVELRIDGCLAGWDLGNGFCGKFPPKPCLDRFGEYDAVWPRDGHAYTSLLAIRNAKHLTISGSGAIDGSGHNWWVAYALGKLPKKRPLAVDIDNSTDIVIKDVAVLDSPRFNVFFGTFAQRIIVERVTVICDWETVALLALAGREICDLAPRLCFADSADAALPPGEGSEAASEEGASSEGASSEGSSSGGSSSPPAKTVEALLSRKAARKLLLRKLPMVPMNTDGVDVSGRDVVIKDSVISNYDDVVAVKPADTLDAGGDALATGCTRNVTVRNLTVYRGVGLSVGSVHPSPNKPCVRDILFEDITLYSPLKGPYVKPDLGGKNCPPSMDISQCSALIENVTYTDITMHHSPLGFKTPPHWESLKKEAYAKAMRGPLGANIPGFIPTPWKKSESVEEITAGSAAEAEADDDDGDDDYDDEEPFTCNSLNYFCMQWPIFLGTQQQLEPDGSGSGIWAPTEPRVSVRDVTFRRVVAKGGVWPMSAGALRCNVSNPCTGLVFEDVELEAEFVRGDGQYICDSPAAASGTVTGKTSPDPSPCLGYVAATPAPKKKNAFQRFFDKLGKRDELR